MSLKVMREAPTAHLQNRAVFATIKMRVIAIDRTLLFPLDPLGLAASTPANPTKPSVVLRGKVLWMLQHNSSPLPFNMKVLFLDVDGVLNNEKSSMGAMFPIDKFAAFLVGKIVLDTDCKVVLSSSWRYMKEAVDEVEKRVVPIFGMTSTKMEGIRGNEIKEWLERHPSVEKYAILDDDDDMLKEQMPNFFRTSWKEGITPQIAREVTDHLK